MDRATYTATACITGAEALTSATGHATAVSSVVEHPTDNGEVEVSNTSPRTSKILLPVPTPIRRWRSTDALTLKVGAWGESELQIPTAEFDSRSTCNVNPMCIHRQQRERQQRLQRQSGAVTARFTSRLLSA